MATPTPQAPLTPEERLYQEQQERFVRVKRNIAIGGVIGFPLLIALPPRKLDFYTFSLVVGTYLSADHLLEHYTSHGVLYHALVRGRDQPGLGSALPTEKAQQIARANEELRAGRESLLEGSENKKSMWQKVYYGDEDPKHWKEKRMEEERQNEEEGKSISEVIFEQIWEVWNWDKKEDDAGETNSGSKKE
ncbi:hypothetical protein EJ04DRAFT_234569 [Polyplosphaeria fusca]|uniref:Uncharacterized protein n=1 Tax=Polyplosphaeria fusca TaxID=682080 RepID=A0A9P4RBU9_9PLEO|nr:hypothetical protein EJ04DRAFT_234569 [Polyplosphaeria fusca]